MPVWRVLEPVHVAALREQRALRARGPRRLVPLQERIHRERAGTVRLTVPGEETQLESDFLTRVKFNSS